MSSQQAMISLGWFYTSKTKKMNSCTSRNLFSSSNLSTGLVIDTTKHACRLPKKCWFTRDATEDFKGSNEFANSQTERDEKSFTRIEGFPNYWKLNMLPARNGSRETVQPFGIIESHVAQENVNNRRVLDWRCA